MPNKKKTLAPAPVIRASPFTNLTNNLPLQQKQQTNISLQQHQQANNLSLLHQQNNLSLQQLQYNNTTTDSLNDTTRYDYSSHIFSSCMS